MRIRDSVAEGGEQAGGPRQRRGTPRCVAMRIAWLGAALLCAAWLCVAAPPLLPPTPSAAADGMPPHLSSDAKAVACRACPEPNEAWYLWEMGPFFRSGGAHPDTYETDGGECKAKPLGVKVSIEGYQWEPAGEGVVQDCPSGRFGCTVDLRLGPDARFEWEVDAEKTRGLEVGRALGVEAAADAATTGTCARGATLSLTQRIEAAYCHRMRWAAAFLLARLRAKADYAVEKRWRWWIKNANWGNEVLYSGDTWRPCEDAHVEMTRLAPVSIHLATSDGVCPDAECAKVTVTKSEGWLPAPPETAPPFTPLPVTTVTEEPPSTPGGAPTTPPAETQPSPTTADTDVDAEGETDGELPHSPYPLTGPIPEPEDSLDDPMPEFSEPDPLPGGDPGRTGIGP